MRGETSQVRLTWAGKREPALPNDARLHSAMPVVQQPAGIPGTFEEHIELMFDLMALAYQTDLTRVSTFMIGREQSTRTYPEIGVPEPHHPVSHHQQRPEYLEKLAKINVLHMQMFASFLQPEVVDADSLARRASQELIDRNSQGLTLDVP